MLDLWAEGPAARLVGRSVAEGEPGVARLDRAMIQGENQVKIQISKLEERDWAVGATLVVVEKALAKAFSEKSESKKRAAS